MLDLFGYNLYKTAFSTWSVCMIATIVMILACDTFFESESRQWTIALPQVVARLPTIQKTAHRKRHVGVNVGWEEVHSSVMSRACDYLP